MIICYHKLELIFTESHQSSEHVSVCTADDPIWQTSDPFDLCSSDTASQWPTSAAKDPALLAEERRRKRQEAYRTRKEARKQQHQGRLLSDLDHDDIFRESPR